MLNTIESYRKIWEQEQRDNLQRDRDDRIALHRGDAAAEDEVREDDKPDALVELERQIDEVMAAKDGDEAIDEEKKDGMAK